MLNSVFRFSFFAILPSSTIFMAVSNEKLIASMLLPCFFQRKTFRNVHHRPVIFIFFSSFFRLNFGEFSSRLEMERQRMRDGIKVIKAFASIDFDVDFY